jgi:hypothetical protein
MPDVFVKIIHPREGAAVSHGHLYVFGLAIPPDSTVAGKITPCDGGPAVNGTPLPGTQVPPAYNWGLVFDGVRPRCIQRLEVTGSKATFKDGNAVHHIHVRHPPTHGPVINISQPPMGGPVGPGFVTAGYVDPDSAAMSAWVQQSGAQIPQAQGAPLTPPPPPYDWAFQFQGVAPPGSYILFVQGVSGTGTTLVPWNITVTA